MSEEQKPTMPLYLKIQGDGNVKVTTREGVFVVKEPSGEQYDAVERIAMNTPNVTDFTKAMMLVDRSLVEPNNIGEQNLKKKYKLSTLKRLAEAVNLYVDETKSFLLDTASDMTEMNGKESSAESGSDLEKPLTKSAE